jgi:hypothetical protein
LKSLWNSNFFKKRKKTKSHKKENFSPNVERASRSFRSKRAACSTFRYPPEQTVISHVFTHRDLDYNFQRHDCVENFMLNCDCYTIASEVPVWMSSFECGGKQSATPLSDRKADAVQKKSGVACQLPPHSKTFVAGHIDLLQWKFDTLYILDFKPNAAKEQKAPKSPRNSISMPSR